MDSLNICLENFQQQNTINHFITKAIPDICLSESCMLGIDEAGRGPVLGPMIYGCCFCPISFENSIKDLGFADSKSLTESEREIIFENCSKNLNYFGWRVEIISPATISKSLNQKCKYNLNEISHNAAINLIKWAVDKNIRIEKVFVDTVGLPEKYKAKLSKHFPSIEFIVSKKADSLYPIVSAASICAKVIRDRCLKTWRCYELNIANVQIGSGYPNDPVTKRFLLTCLQKVFGYPQLVRFPWSTVERILEKEAVKVIWPEDETLGQTLVEPPGKKQHSILKYFKTSSSKSLLTTLGFKRVAYPFCCME